MDRVANGLVGEERGKLEASKEENRRSGPETQDDTEQGRLKEAVVFVTFVAFVSGVAGRKVAQQTFVVERTANGIQNEDGDNQEGENVISETGCEAYVASQIKEGCNRSVHADPDTDPRVEGKEGDFLKQQ